MLYRDPMRLTVQEREKASASEKNSLWGTENSHLQRESNSFGEPLDASTRAYFETRFGYDFGRVRVHADSVAASAARSKSALAYTIGSNIVFGDGQYNPGSHAGRQLLAHELTHVVQQNNLVGSRASGPECEREAAVAGHLIGRGERLLVRLAGPAIIQRQPISEPLLHLDLAESASPLVAQAIGSVTLDAFVTNKADVPSNNQAKLAQTVNTIKTLLRQYPASTILVIGYTDAVGEEAHNEVLRQSRADSVQDALVKLGVPGEVIHTQKGAAENLLVKTKKAEPRNRRVEVLFQPSKRFQGAMTKGLSLSQPTQQPQPTPGQGVIPTPQSFCAQNPKVCFPGGDSGRPTVPPAALQPIPDNIPFHCMDVQSINEPYTSHGNRPEGEDLRQVWAQLYLQYRAYLSEKQACWAANHELSATAGKSQSRDNPNTEDRLDQDIQREYPDATKLGPVPLKTWRF